MSYKIFIASSGNSRDWAGDLQESLENTTPEEFQFEVWDQDIFHPSSFILSDLIRRASSCSAAIFIFAPDDQIIINGQQHTITRDNVIFELGLFTGRIGLDKVIILSPSDTKNYRLLSDLDGLQTFRFSFKPHHDNNRLSALGPTVNGIKRHLERVLKDNPTVNLGTLESVGLTEATYTTHHSAFSYVEAINASSTQFRLLGVGADKVTTNQEEFGDLIERVISNRGNIRLLMLDPNCYTMVVSSRRQSELDNLRENVKKSLLRIADYINIFNCQSRLSIRSYFALTHDHMPPFRLTFVDDDRCIVSPRSFAEKDRSGNRPQLIFKRSTTGNECGYYGAFNNYFESLWLQASEETVETMLAKIEELPQRKVPFGCVHGRFQPPHTGHLHYILKAKARCNLLFIGVTQPDNDSLTKCHRDPHRSEAQNNPLSRTEREEALRRMLAEKSLVERRDYIILPFDIDSPELLKGYIQTTWIQYTTLINPWNVYKNARLRQLGYEVESVADRREDESISGTAIRSLAKSGDREYRRMLTPAVCDYLDEIDFEDRIRKL